MNSNTSFLDLLCNGIGAMMLILILVSTKHFVRPELPQKGIMVLEASSLAPGVKLGLWLDDAASGRPLVNEEVATIVAPDENAVPAAGSEAVRSTRFPGAMFLRRVSGSIDSEPTSVALVLFDPTVGDYRGAVFVEDIAGEPEDWPETVRVGFRVWFRRAWTSGWDLPSRATDVSRHLPAHRALPVDVVLNVPTSSRRFCFRVRDDSTVEVCD